MEGRGGKGEEREGEGGGGGEGGGEGKGGGRGRRKCFSAMNKPAIQYDLLNASCCYFTDTYILLALAILLEQQVTPPSPLLCSGQFTLPKPFHLFIFHCNSTLSVSIPLLKNHDGSKNNSKKFLW